MLWVFDINETMLDLAPLDEVFARHAGTAAARREWFDLLIHTALVTTTAGRYEDFSQIGADCARTVARRRGGGFSDAGVRELAAEMRRLPAHPEAPGALAALRERGHRLVALGNSPQAVIDAQLGNAGLAPIFHAVYSAEHAGMLKPAAAPYRLVLEAEGVAADQSVMVAAHDWDVAGAQAVGMRAAFVAREGRVPLPGWPEPDIVAPDLAEAVSADLA